MNRWLLKSALSALVLAALTLIAAAAEPPQDAVRREMRMLQGVWKVVSVERNGKPAPNDDIKEGTVFIQGNRFIIQTMDKHQDKEYGLDPAQRPKGIDLRNREGRGRDKLVRGIYLLERDRLKLCLGDAGQERPEKFSTEPGAGRRLIVLERPASGSDGDFGRSARLAQYLWNRPAVGDRAPDFTLHDIEGKEVRLRDFAGKRPVVLELGSYT